jgi:hypothetical protein
LLIISGRPRAFSETINKGRGASVPRFLLRQQRNDYRRVVGAVLEREGAQQNVPGDQGKLRAVPALRKWNERPGQLVIVHDGFSFAAAGRGKLLTAPFKSMLLGAADVLDKASLAAQRCSTFLCM